MSLDSSPEPRTQACLEKVVASLKNGRFEDGVVSDFQGMAIFIYFYSFRF